MIKGAIMNNNLFVSFRLPESNSVFNCDFERYKKRIIYLYCLSPFFINELRFYLIISNLKQRAVNGRLLPKPERVLKIIKRLSLKGG